MTTQLDYTVTLGKESTYGTAVTPSRSFDTDAELDVNEAYMQSAQMRAMKRVAQKSRNARSRREVSGPMSLDVPTKGFGFLLNAVLGAVANTAVPTLTPTRYQQVHTLTKTDPVASYTIQESLPRLDGGAAFPQTFTGCVASGIELSCKEGDFLKAKVDWVGRDMSTAIAATAASYPVGDGLFQFVHASVGYQGTLTPPTTTAVAALSAAAAINVKDVSVSIKNGLDTGGYNAGGAGKRTRPPVLGVADITGKMTVEYTDNVLRDAYLNGTLLPLVQTYAHDDGVSVLQIVTPCIRIKSEVPKSKGGAPITQSIDFQVLDDEVTAEPVWIVYRTTDTAP